MKSENEQDILDLMPWLREAKERIYEETKDMSAEERRAYFARPPADPQLAEWWNRLPRSEGRGTNSQPIGQ